MTLEQFPLLNATLNGASAVILAFGYVMIRSRRPRLHAWSMITALVTSTAFLACYLIYHTLRARQGIVVTRFPDSPWRPLYLAILFTHTPLAVLILPLIGITLYRAYHRDWARHRQIARITFPLWFYVSVTGVIIYLMLYRLAPLIRPT